MQTDADEINEELEHFEDTVMNFSRPREDGLRVLELEDTNIDLQAAPWIIYLS
jgi:hypothetical protein